jgi:hypothetical protein
VSVKVALGKRRVCGGVEIAEHRKNTVMVSCRLHVVWLYLIQTEQVKESVVHNVKSCDKGRQDFCK